MNSFLGIETLSRSLYGQQVNEGVLASNLAKTYRDSDGYVIASRQRVDMTTSASLLVGGMGGPFSVGQGPQIQQITRMRSFFLDVQIQRQSQQVGYTSVRADVMTHIQTILNTGTNTISDALTNLAASFTALSAAPTSVGLRDTVVNNGVAFADMARQQYGQLETLQINVNTEIANSVDTVNSILQEIHTLNVNLLAAQGAPANDLLDARDYAVTRLSRLLNVTASYGNKGTVSVALAGVTLANQAGAAQFDTNLINDYNPPLANIRVQTIGGTTIDMTGKITSGKLGGLLTARDVTLDFYKDSLDEVVHSVIDVTNVLHRSGYAADGLTTNIEFFTGVSARDINVNASIVADPTRAGVAASARYGDTANGDIARYLGNLPSLHSDDMMLTVGTINNFLGRIDPTQALGSAVTTALNGTGSNAVNIQTIPVGGTFTVNSVVTTFTNADSVYDILDAINAADPNVHAVFNYVEQKVYLLSNNTVTVNNGTSNLKNLLGLNNQLSSTVRMNNGFSPSDILINPNFPMNGQFPALGVDNPQAFKITPGTTGTVLINGVAVNWNSGQSLNQIIANINAVALLTGVGAQFSTGTQEVTLRSANPITIIDRTGNFTAFTGLNGTVRLGNEASAIGDKADSDFAAAKTLYNQAENTLTQLNNAQANVAALSFSESEAGTPFEVEQANAVKSLIAFNAALQTLQIMDKMLSDLVGIVGGSSGGSLFSGRQS